MDTISSPVSRRYFAVVLSALALLGFAVSSAAAPPEVGPAAATAGTRRVTVPPPERPDDPPASTASLGLRAEGPPALVPFGPATSVQVNVNASGNNILGDAANEPTIAIDRTNPNHIAIGWRQFDTVANNFRQAGHAYSTDGGQTWTFPGVLQPGVFRSDPVMASDAGGTFYFCSLSTPGGGYAAEVFRSMDGGITWLAPVEASGGDKQWLVVDDRPSGMGAGHVYENWNVQFSCCPPNDFTRSINGAASFQSPIAIPLPSMKWGTLSVGSDGTLYIAGATLNQSGHLVTRSSNARDPDVTPAFDFVNSVSLGGQTGGFGGASDPNPGGLLGQVWLAADPSQVNRLYVLASVIPPAGNPLDVMFARSVNKAVSWSAPVRVNDDPASGAFHWFGTMSVAPNGRIDVVWNDTRNSGIGYISQLFYSFSVDTGFTWSPNEALSPAWNSHEGWPNQNKIGDYYHMISDNGGASLAYSATFNFNPELGQHEQDVYFLRIMADCNDNGIPDDQDVVDGAPDCNHNLIPDECEPNTDCNNNGIADICDIFSGVSADCNLNLIPDECENPADCNNNGQADFCDIAAGAPDCNLNGIPDECDISSGTSHDCNGNHIPDECDLSSSASRDCNGNSIPDECDIASGLSHDCQPNGIPDECDIVAIERLVNTEAAVLGFVDISASGTPLNLGDDTAADVVVPFPLPVPGGPTVSVANNGGVGLVSGTGLGPVDNWPLPSTNAFGDNAGMLVFWDDLDATTGNVYYQTIGSSPSRTFIVQWYNRPHYPGDVVLDGDEATFQVQIFETPVGGIAAQYLYNDTNFLDAQFNNGASATVGYQRDATYALQWSFNTAGAVNSSVVLSLLNGDSNGNGVLDECEAPPPGSIVWDTDPLSANRTTRSLRFRVDAAATASGAAAGENAIKVELVSLHHPDPRNATQFPPPNASRYSTFDTNTNGVCSGATPSPNYNGHPCNTDADCVGCPCNGDVDNSGGFVNFTDVSIVGNCANNGNCAACVNSCDVNCDGDINSDDIAATVCLVQGQPPTTCCLGASADGVCIGNPAPPLVACTGEVFPANAQAEGGCARWVGRPGTFYEGQDAQDLGSYRAARLQCTPFYFDWVTETAGNVCAAPFLGPTNTGLPCATDADCGGRVCVLSTNHGDPCTADAQCPGGTCPPTCIPKKITVVGAGIMPSSEYSVQTYGASCKGSEVGCTNVSAPVQMLTRQHGDLYLKFYPGSLPLTDQPDSRDVSWVVESFKKLSTGLVKAIAKITPNLPEENLDVDAMDISSVLDATKGYAYRFGGPCPCPSAATCGALACPLGTDSVCTGSALPGLGAEAKCIKTCTGGPNDGEPCLNGKHCGNTCATGPRAGVLCHSDSDCWSGNLCTIVGTCGTPLCRDRCGRCTP